MMNNVDWDEPINQKILQDCHRCNDFIITDQKDELTLFMYDHYGKDGIRKCMVLDNDIPRYRGDFADE
jgi:hypothetical protein